MLDGRRQVDQLSLHGDVGGEEDEHHPGDRLVGGRRRRQCGRGALVAVGLDPAVELGGIGSGGRLVVGGGVVYALISQFSG